MGLLSIGLSSPGCNPDALAVGVRFPPVPLTEALPTGAGNWLEPSRTKVLGVRLPPLPLGPVAQRPTLQAYTLGFAGSSPAGIIRPRGETARRIRLKP